MASPAHRHPSAACLDRGTPRAGADDRVDGDGPGGRRRPSNRPRPELHGDRRARRAHRLRVSTARRPVLRADARGGARNQYGRAMQAWILDESPGSYRWGDIATPEAGPGEVLVKVVTSALNHMDLWVTRGMPKPPLPHVPGCDVAGIVEAVGDGVVGFAAGDEVVINPSVSPIEDVLKYGIDSPVEHLVIFGEHCWGGHAEYAVAPVRNVVRRPANRSWEESAAF